MAASDHLDQAITTTQMMVTALHSLAASQTWITGWFSANVNNTASDYLDFMVCGSFTTHASNRQAGVINVFVVGYDTTPTIPATATGTLGTEGLGSFADTYRRNSLVRQVAGIEVDATASAVYVMPPMGIAQLFGWELPPYWSFYVSHNASTTTTAGLAAAGSTMCYTPKYRRST